MSHVLFIVADTNSPPILGLNTSEKLGLIRRIMEVDVKDVPDNLLQFSDCFGDKGKLPQTHHIEVKPDVTPVIHPPRRIPYAFHKQSTLLNWICQMHTGKSRLMKRTL